MISVENDNQKGTNHILFVLNIPRKFSHNVATNRPPRAWGESAGEIHFLQSVKKSLGKRARDSFLPVFNPVLALETVSEDIYYPQLHSSEFIARLIPKWGL